MVYDIIITNDGDGSVETLKNLKVLGKHWKVMDVYDFLNGNNLLDVTVDKIFIDCEIDCKSSDISNILQDIDATYMRRVKRAALSNNKVKLVTFTSDTPTALHLTKVTQLPNVGDADATLGYEISVGRDTLCYGVEDGEFQCIGRNMHNSNDWGVDQVLGFIGLVKIIACSYYENVGVIIHCVTPKESRDDVKIIPRDITFDNVNHNIVINM